MLSILSLPDQTATKITQMMEPTAEITPIIQPEPGPHIVSMLKIPSGVVILKMWVPDQELQGPCAGHKAASSPASSLTTGFVRSEEQVLTWYPGSWLSN